jgi:hypothetical protein
VAVRPRSAGSGGADVFTITTLEIRTHILVVAGSPALRDAVTLLVADEGYAVSAVGDARDLGTARCLVPDAVVWDLPPQAFGPRTLARLPAERRIATIHVQPFLDAVAGALDGRFHSGR